jgi:O-antigen/teichoic acid export membrane protein
MTLPRLSNTRALQTYQLMRAGAGILTGIFLSKTGLSTADIGIWESLLFLGSLVIFTGVNGFLQGITPIFTPLPPPERAAFTTHVFILFFGIGLALFLLFQGTGAFLVPALTGLPEVPGFLWFSVYLWLNISSLPVEIMYLLQQRPMAIVGWGILGFGGQMLAVCLPVMLGYGIVTGVQWLCVLGGIKLLWALRLVWQSGQWSFSNLHPLKQYVQISTPLALNSFTGNLIQLFDSWLVGFWFAQPAVFALYRYGSREFPWASALATALSTAAVPGITAQPETGMADLKQRTTRLLHAVMPVTILILVATPYLFPVVFSPDFQPSAVLFQIYLLVTMSRVLLPNSVLIGLQETNVIFYTGLGELALKIITGFVFVRWWGLEGIAWSVVVSFWFEKIVLMAYLWHQKGIPPQRWLPVRWFLLYSGLLIVAFIWCR